jgi:hypothetical protein
MGNCFGKRRVENPRLERLWGEVANAPGLGSCGLVLTSLNLVFLLPES